MQFRIGNRLCYHKIDKPSICYSLGNEDPLLEENLKKEDLSPKDMRTMRYILDFYRANEEILAGDKIIP
jgi:hypothetical protein